MTSPFGRRRETYVCWMPFPTGSLCASGSHVGGLRRLCPCSRRQEAHGMSVRQIAGGLTCIKLIRVHPELSTAVGTGGETGEAERIWAGAWEVADATVYRRSFSHSTSSGPGSWPTTKPWGWSTMILCFLAPLLEQRKKKTILFFNRHPVTSR